MQVDKNYYIATLRLSSNMTDFKTVMKDDGVQIRIAQHPDGTLKVQSILFPKDKYNNASAHISASLLEKFWT